MRGPAISGKATSQSWQIKTIISKNWTDFGIGDTESSKYDRGSIFIKDEVLSILTENIHECTALFGALEYALLPSQEQYLALTYSLRYSIEFGHQAGPQKCEPHLRISTRCSKTNSVIDKTTTICRHFDELVARNLLVLRLSWQSWQSMRKS